MTFLLPPLPVLPGEGERYRYMPGGDSIIALFDAEHATLASLVSDSLNSTSIDALTAMLCRHLSAERQYLYPAWLKLDPEASSAVAAETGLHRRLLAATGELIRAQPGSPERGAALETVTAIFAAHENTCRTTISPVLHSRMSAVDLVRLGNRAEIALEAAPSRPHPGAPMDAPWNKITDAFIGLADKARDVFTRRQAFAAPTRREPSVVRTR
jgi:hypothetical protein